MLELAWPNSSLCAFRSFEISCIMSIYMSLDLCRHRNVDICTIVAVVAMLSLSLLFLITALLFAHGAHAFRAFEPNCTSPHDYVTRVSPPPLRGTMDIIFSCFSVLLICTWAIQHLSVPPHKTHFWNHKIIKSKQYSAFLDDARFNYTKLKWMGISPRSRVHPCQSSLGTACSS